MSENRQRDAAREMAHLRSLLRCRTCGAPASEQLFTGRNDPVAVFCSRHAAGALRRFKEGERV